ncbi:MAG TPA: discoidin domain-containing protein [Polyangiaceae bacterium]|nr:discoidin domain-containing protein [Polyangiaceae bacterium]
MARRVSRLLIDTIIAWVAIAAGCVNQSFEVGSMDPSAPGADPRGFLGDHGSSGGSASLLPIGGSQPSEGSVIGGSVSAAGLSAGGSVAVAGTSVGADNTPGAGGADSGNGRTVCAAPQNGMLLNTSAWKATASNTSPDVDPSVVLDPQAPQTWTSGIDQYAGLWFQIDMLQPECFYSVAIDSTSAPGEAAIALSFSTSIDGSFVDAPIMTGILGNAHTQLTFDTPQHARYLRLTVTLDANKWWSIDSISVRH